MRADRVQVALPESFEDHSVGRARPFQEARDVERRVGRQDLPDPGSGGRQIGQIAIVGDRRRFALRIDARLFDSRVGVGGLQDRLFMAGPLSQHRIEAKADEQGDKGKDDDGGQGSNSVTGQAEWPSCPT